jgi:hypothetical protein
VNVQVNHVAIHTPEQVREIVTQARDIAYAVAPDMATWPAVFQEASRMLGERFTLAMHPQQTPIDLSALKAGANSR